MNKQKFSDPSYEPVHIHDSKTYHTSIGIVGRSDPVKNRVKKEVIYINYQTT